MHLSADCVNGTEGPSSDEPGSVVPFNQRDSLYIVIPITIAYALIFVTGVLGNIVTCIVIARNKYMHTATNYYLFSLSLSDLLLLITGLPQEMVSIWYKYPYMFGEAFCILRGLAAETSANATVLTITAFTVERYIAICYPFWSHTMSKLSRAVKIIILIWILALIFAMPHAAQVGVIIPNGDPELTSCTVKQPIFKHLFELSILLFFVVPMTIITVLYALIGLKLRRTNALKRDSGSFYKACCEQKTQQPSRRHVVTNQSSRRVVKMLVAVVAAFFICWAPFHAQRLVAIYGVGEDKLAKDEVMIHIYGVLTYVSGILYYLSATINPILYHIMSLKFRKAFKETLLWRQSSKHKHQHSQWRRHKLCHRRGGQSESPLFSSSGTSGLLMCDYGRSHRRNHDYNVLGRGYPMRRSFSSCSTDNSQSQSFSEYGGCHGLIAEQKNSRNQTSLLSSSETRSECESDVLSKQQNLSGCLKSQPLKQSSATSCFGFLKVYRKNLKLPKGVAYYYIDSLPYEMAVKESRNYAIRHPRTPQREISNSSLKDFNKSALQDELNIYMSKENSF